jgi:hypothetical protein
MAKERLHARIVWFLCAPSLVGVAGLGLLWLALHSPSSDRVSAAVLTGLGSFAPTLFVLAAYGPVLVILAALVNLMSGGGRIVQWRRWTAPILGAAASVLFYGLLMNAIELP